MKKTFLLFMLLVACVSAYAQKSYIQLFAFGINTNPNYPNIYISGDIPDGFDVSGKSIGRVLNLLAEEGYEVEHMDLALGYYAGTTPTTASYLLSKKLPSTNPEDPDVVTIQREIDDVEAHEVARFNLQGLPVNKDARGVQIVVYSNYTTKTVIVE